MFGFSDFRDFMESIWFPFACIGLAFVVGLWLFVDRKIDQSSYPKDMGTKFQRIGPEFQTDGLYRIDYEDKTYLLYQSDGYTVIVEHEAGRSPDDSE